jgi:hypothetical protein
MLNAETWVQTFGGLGPKQRAAVVCALHSVGATAAALDRRKAFGTLRLLAQTADGPVVFSVTPRGWAKRTTLDARRWMFPR